MEDVRRRRQTVERYGDTGVGIDAAVDDMVRIAAGRVHDRGGSLAVEDDRRPTVALRVVRDRFFGAAARPRIGLPQHLVRQIVRVDGIICEVCGSRAIRAFPRTNEAVQPGDRGRRSRQRRSEREEREHDNGTHIARIPHRNEQRPAA